MTEDRTTKNNTQVEIKDSYDSMFLCVVSVNLVDGTFETIKGMDFMEKTIKGMDIPDLDTAAEAIIPAGTSPIYWDDAQSFVNLKTLADRLKNREKLTLEFRGSHPEWEWCRATWTVKERDEDGNAVKALLVIEEISEQMNERLRIQKETVFGRNRRTLLIVEDNEINRGILVSMLEDEYNIIEAEDGEEGYKKLAENYRSIDVVLLDLVMPNCDGYQFMESVSKVPELSSVPVIIITSMDSDEVEKKCIEMGAADFISKKNSTVFMKKRINNVIRMNDITELLETIEMDELTGLYTKQAFVHHAKELLDSNPDIDYDILVIGVQNFKVINNIYGERIGDEILKHMAFFGASNIPGGICARYSGDKFVGLLPSMGTNYEKWLSEKLEEYSEFAPVQGVMIKNGVYEKVDRKLTVTAMCDRALLALKSLKHDFSKNTAYFDEPLSQKELRMQKYETWFYEGIKNHEFVLRYQPKHNPVTEKIVGAEALVRWKRNGKLTDPPTEFIETFEENGQIVQLDEYVFREVCAQQKKWQDEGMELIPISINLSRKSMHGPDLVERYRNIADEIGIDSRYIPIEITESAAVASEEIKPLADAFYEAGFYLHMDDFGSGNSSLNGLGILHFDVVKLDKSLIDTIGTSRGDTIMEYTINLIRNLGMKTVCEGVENEEQLDFLRKLNCDAIQGYYFSGALEEEKFEALVKQQQGMTN